MNFTNMSLKAKPDTQNNPYYMIQFTEIKIYI